MIPCCHRCVAGDPNFDESLSINTQITHPGCSKHKKALDSCTPLQLLPQNSTISVLHLTVAAGLQQQQWQVSPVVPLLRAPAQPCTNAASLQCTPTRTLAATSNATHAQTGRNKLCSTSVRMPGKKSMSAACHSDTPLSSRQDVGPTPSTHSQTSNLSSARNPCHIKTKNHRTQAS